MKSIPVRQIDTAWTEHNDTPGRLKVRDVGTLLNQQDLKHDLHRHNFYFLLVLQKATGVHEVDFVRYDLRDRSVFLLRPGQVHRLELHAGSQGVLIEFDRHFYKPENPGADHRWKKSLARQYCAPRQEDFDKMYALLREILNEYTLRRVAFHDAILDLLDLFFILYVRQSETPLSKENSGNVYTQDRFEEFMRLLEENLTGKKGVADYATLLRLSAYQLNAITRTMTGKTVSELINDQIVLEAKRHLLATSSQIKEIADLLGYEDISYFIRFFKKHTGYTPDAFRRNFK